VRLHPAQRDKGINHIRRELPEKEGRKNIESNAGYPFFCKRQAKREKGSVESEAFL